MNKKFAFYALALSAILLIGCGRGDKNNDNAQKPSSEDSTQSDLPGQSVDSAPNNSSSGSQNSDGANSDTSGEPISEAEAKYLALRHSGLKEDEVTFEAVELETGENGLYFDVEFRSKNGIEYDYAIDYYTGEILEYDYDIEDVINPTDDQAPSPTDQEKMSEEASRAR